MALDPLSPPREPETPSLIIPWEDFMKIALNGIREAFPSLSFVEGALIQFERYNGACEGMGECYSFPPDQVRLKLRHPLIERRPHNGK